MSRTKLVVTVAMLAVMLAVGAGSVAFAAPQQPDQQTPDQQQQPSPGPGIVGGSAVPNSNKYPWIAALLDVNRKVAGGTDQDMQICGASLIDSDSVLTAAHCINTAPRYLRVVLGRAQLSASGGEVRQVLRTYKHPNYPGGDRPPYDVAVLTLDKPVTGITPVKLPPSTDNWYEQPGKQLTAAGWGFTMSGDPSTGGPNTDRMQETKVSVVSDADAAKIYSTKFVADLMMAAGEVGKGACYGDSGGPLFSTPIGLGGSKRPEPSQYGITSFGEDVCATNPAVYTEVNAPEIRKFITCRQLTTPNYTPTYCWAVYKPSSTPR